MLVRGNGDGKNGGGGDGKNGGGGDGGGASETDALTSGTQGVIEIVTSLLIGDYYMHAIFTFIQGKHYISDTCMSSIKLS